MNQHPIYMLGSTLYCSTNACGLSPFKILLGLLSAHSLHSHLRPTERVIMWWVQSTSHLHNKKFSNKMECIAALADFKSTIPFTYLNVLPFLWLTFNNTHSLYLLWIFSLACQFMTPQKSMHVKLMDGAVSKSQSLLIPHDSPR